MSTYLRWIHLSSVVFSHCFASTKTKDRSISHTSTHKRCWAAWLPVCHISDASPLPCSLPLPQVGGTLQEALLSASTSQSQHKDSFIHRKNTQSLRPLTVWAADEQQQQQQQWRGRVEAADIPDKPVILRFMWYTGTCFPLSESHRQTQYWGFCFLRGSEILLHVILFSSLSLITVCRVEGHRKRWLYGRLHWHEGVSQVTFLKPNKNISAHKATTRVHVVFNFWLVGWLYMCYGFHCHLFP